MGSLLSSRCAAAAVALCSVGCAMGNGEVATWPRASETSVPRGPSPACTLPPGDWVWFRDFWFDTTRADIQSADAEKIDDIVALLSRQPGRCVAIDGTTRERDSDLGRRRIANVRDALLRAGVGAERILTGDLGDPGLRHAQRVEVLVGPP